MRTSQLGVTALGALLLGVLGRGTWAGDGTDAVQIDEPEEGAVVGTSIRLAGHVPRLPANAIAVLRVNGANVDVRDGRFETVVGAKGDGPLVLRVVFSEIGVPAAVAERNVVVDATPPLIEIDVPPQEKGVFADGEGRISGVARDPHLKSVRMNGGDVPFDGHGAFDVVFLLPPTGSMGVEIEAVDAVGNRATAKRILQIGPTPAPPPAPAPPAPAPPAPAPPAPTSPAAAAVEDALRWLQAHQSPDGGWECEGFRKWCDKKPVSGEGPDGPGKAQYDVGVTGLALLAFLGAGYTPESQEANGFGKAVSAGLHYLKASQDTEGCFGSRSTGHYVYNHAIAALAMVEAYGMTGSMVYKNPAQKALDFIAIARNPSFAWRYGVRPGDNDTSVTGWMAMALESAKLANDADVKAGKSPSLRLDGECFAGIKAWIDKMTDPDHGRVGYQQRGTGPARPTELVDKFPAAESESMTAVGLLVRLALGEDLESSPALRNGVALCSALPPRWDTRDGSIDMYYWYYATRALARVGGPPWADWRTQLLAAVLREQRRDTDPCAYRGSWDPLDPWGPDGGRVYATAMLAMCLETADRSVPADVKAPSPAPSAPPPPSPRPNRLRELRDRASKWALLRQDCLNACQNCGGTGAVPGHQRCPACGGTRRVFNKNLERQYVDMRSPAWHRWAGSKAEFDSYYHRLLRGEEASPWLRSYRFGDGALLDDAHAVLPVFENGATLPVETRWIWSSTTATGAGTWYLYSEQTDGPWPG